MPKKFKILILFISLNSCSQNGNIATDTSRIELQFNDYLKKIENKQFEKSLNHLPNELFDFVPKSQMLKILNETFNNPEMDFSYTKSKILKIGQPVKIKKKYYSLLRYEATLKMKINDQDSLETIAEKKERVEKHKSLVRGLFGEDVKSYNANTEYFDIYESKEAYAIIDESSVEWKFLVLEKDSQVLIDKILPKELEIKY